MPSPGEVVADKKDKVSVPLNLQCEMGYDEGRQGLRQQAGGPNLSMGPWKGISFL